MMKLSPSKQNITFSILASIITLFILPPILYQINPNWAENILVGASIFLVLQIYIISHNTSNIKNIILDNETLRNVDKNYKQLRENPQKKFFVKWYESEFKTLENKSRDSLNNNYITFSASRFSYEDNPVYSVFDKNDCNFLYASCTCDGVKGWITGNGHAFIQQIHREVAEENIVLIRRIFIFDENDFDYNTKKLKPLIQFALTLHNRGKYEAKLIEKKTYLKLFDEAKAKSRIANLKSDFSMFGHDFVWETLEDYTNNILVSGNFSLDEDRRKFYRKFFNSLWDRKDKIIQPIEQYIDTEITAKCEENDDITKLRDMYENYESEMKNEKEK
ncbi:MAG: hypothetical protein FWC14_05445 [Candidatus Bathyarchaeota archaeon]|uniref:hypothetical protein n=1 Tax=Candidatus Bathycorpusculum sp. TaxID=2994959 RepID=UPI00282A29E1|nr:hypothetical protein [Candidatus Termiticorpusculum sp.]MCL2291752.1 hypothetical protein [Candidatus Termiticorpusculum sp.]